MSHKFLILILTGLCMVMSGCDYKDNSSPSAVIKSAAYALSQEDYSTFYQYLNSPASADYGYSDHHARAQELKNYLSPYNLKFKKPVITGGYGLISFYEVEVYGTLKDADASPQLVLDLEITCDHTEVTDNNSSDPYSYEKTECGIDTISKTKIVHSNAP